MSISFNFWRFLVVYILNPTILIPIGVYLWSRNRPSLQKPDWLPNFIRLEFLEFAFGVVGTSLAFAGIRNLGFLHFSRPIAYVATLYVLMGIPTGLPRKKLWYLAAMVVGLLAAFLGLFQDTLTHRNTLFTTVQSLVFLLLSSLEFQELLTGEDSSHLQDRPEFWFLSALMVFASGSLLFNATSNYFLRTLPRDLLPIPWVAVSVVYAAYHILLAKVFLCRNHASS